MNKALCSNKQACIAVRMTCTGLNGSTVLLQRKAEQAAERAAANQEAKHRAEERIASALHSNKEILVKRREGFDIKQSENEERRKSASANLVQNQRLTVAVIALAVGIHHAVAGAGAGAGAGRVRGWEGVGMKMGQGWLGEGDAIFSDAWIVIDKKCNFTLN